jgi:hypothetical protein
MILAHKYGTDNEGYEILVTYTDGMPQIGCDLPAINFCPWCGKEVTAARDATEVK